MKYIGKLITIIIVDPKEVIEKLFQNYLNEEITTEVDMKLFGNKKAAHGRLVKLANNSKKAVESEFYFAMWVENSFDSDEKCLLFSQSDLNKIKDVKFCDFTNSMDLGKLYLMGNAESYFVKIKDLDNKEKVVRLNSTVINNGTKRAIKNPEDVPSKGLIQDLLD